MTLQQALNAWCYKQKMKSNLKATNEGSDIRLQWRRFKLAD